MTSTISFRVKICGVRTRDDLVACARAGAEAVGLNFYPPSVRYLAPEVARELATEARAAGLCRIGVFVDQPLRDIVQTVQQVGLDAVQLHGSEGVEEVLQLRQQGIAVIRAVRLSTEPLAPETIEATVAPWREAGALVVLDAEVGTAAGGMGQQLDWDAIAAWSARYGGADRWILAGGLTPETVEDAIRRCRPYGVDVASGVEEPRGVKSPQRLGQFVSQARAALELPVRDLGQTPCPPAS